MAEVLQLSGTGIAAQLLKLRVCSFAARACRKAAQGRQQWWHKACSIAAHGLDFAARRVCSIAVQSLLGTPFWNATGNKRLDKKKHELDRATALDGFGPVVAGCAAPWLRRHIAG